MSSRLDRLEAKRAGPYGRGLEFDSCANSVYDDVMVVINMKKRNKAIKYIEQGLKNNFVY